MEELAQLYHEDQTERDELDWSSSEQMTQLTRKDRIRREKVAKLYEEGKIITGEDFHHAAMVYQHGERPDDFKLAHAFAGKALELGDESVRWLFAATLDRYLISSGKPQKYGTQFRLNTETEEWELHEPVDPTVTDEERAKYNVPPLSQASEKFKEKYSKKI